MKHGDTLFHNTNREIFICNQDIETVVEWISAQEHGNNVSPNIFERIKTPDTLALSLTSISGSGFGLSFDGRVEVDDLIRIQESDNIPTFLDGQIGRVIKSSAETMECRFLTMNAEKHHQLLTYIANHMTVDDFQNRLKPKRASQRTS